MADVTVTLAVDGKQVKTGLDSARRDVQKFAKGTQKDLAASGAGRMTAIGKGMGSAIAGLAVGAKIGSVVNEYARLADLSSRLGVSAESMQRVGIAAEQAGSDAETAARALTLLTRALDNPDNKKATEAFQQLGINLKELKAADAFDQIKMLSTAFQRAQTTGTGFSDIMDLLGKSGAELIPLLRMTQSELDGISQTTVVSDQQIEQIAKLDDRMMALQRTISVGFAKGTAGVASIWEDFVKGATNAFVQTQTVVDSLAAGKTVAQSLEDGNKMLVGLYEEESKELKAAADEAERLKEARKEMVPVERAIADEKKKTETAKKEAKQTGVDTNGDGFTSKREQRVYDLEQRRGQRKADAIKGFSRGAAGLANFGGLAEFKEMQNMSLYHGSESVGLRWKGVKSTDPIGTIAARNITNKDGGTDRIVSQLDKLTNVVSERLIVD